jgi:hypothetical protein
MFQHIPWFSTFTLFTELLVTTSILYSLYSAYRRNYFPYALVAVTLAYEVLFNISYMASRALGGQNPSKLAGSAVIGLAIFHGIFSLIMFLSLLVFMSIAWVKYRKGINYFQLHKNFTLTFVVLWLIAVASGFVFYYIAYLA